MARTIPLALAITLLVGSATVLGQEPSHAAYLPVPAARLPEALANLQKIADLPLKSFRDAEARNKTGAQFTILCDFNHDGSANSSRNFGHCYELANKLDELRKLDGVQVIAYVHGPVSGHSVMPVLACGRVILSAEPPATLGNITDGKSLLREPEIKAYEAFARGRYPMVFIQKMYDSQIQVIRRAAPVNGEIYANAEDVPRPEGSLVEDLPRGIVGNYNLAQLKKFGLVPANSEPINSLDALRLAEGLPRDLFYQMPDKPMVWLKVLSGNVDGAMRERTNRYIRRALAENANVLIFQLECGNGSPQAAMDLALDIARIGEKYPTRRIETIAYVTKQASNTASLLALGCNRLIMQRDARLGDFDRLLQNDPALESILQQSLGDLAERQHYPRVLAESLVNQKLVIHQVSSTRGNTRTYLSQEDLQRQKDAWTSLRIVKEAGQRLILDAATARDLGLASDIKDRPEQVADVVGIDPGEIREDKEDMLDDLANFLRNPWTSVVLVMVGLTCLILELKMPGVTLPGVMAALCFVLFFWSQSQLNGQIAWLALLLFVLGVIFLALEIFVLPGFGICGISGILLLVGSLGLAAYGHWPTSPEEWLGYGRSLAPIGLSILGSFILAMVVARYLPHIPYANQLLLTPPGEAAELDDGADAIRPELAGLLGAIGVAVTPLRPAGKTQFGEEYIDVVAEGSYIEAGTRVQVIEIEGNRVVVKDV